ncbi:MAG TPA: DUF6600 domain-containing protein [Acidobacteriota bacterium]|nr:DUF6600 domain-containing protein [Acidobacteriota bacterium]
MNTKLKSALIAILILGAGSVAMADFNFGIRSHDFYLSVGQYDYYPYGVPQGYTPRISFYDVMSDYGSWAYYQPFGRVWRPYVDAQWRPYVYGHWTYTQYGPTWQGYEPWAWVGYHYGDWVFTQEFGWVWVPGYDWHPGRVAWSYGTDTIGWMPAPPAGYDYYEGSIRYYGNDHRYNYDYDDSYGYNSGYYGYGRPVTNLNVNLWIFINTNHYRSDNYADYCLDRNRTQELFTRRAVRISAQPFERTQLERIVKQRVEQVPVEVREVETERKAVRMVIPSGEEEHIRKNANRVVQDVIKPGFQKERRNFKGQDVRNEKAVETIFKQQPAEIKNPGRVSEERDVRNNGKDIRNNNDVRNNNLDRKNRDTQFEDRGKQGSRELNSKPPVQDDRRFEAPDRSQGADKRAPKAASDNRSPEVDRNRYLGPPQRKYPVAGSNDTEQQNRPDMNQQRRIDSRDRDVQFDRNTGKGGADKVDSSDRNLAKDSKVIREQDNSGGQTKQADQKRNSNKDQKKQKDKKNNNGNTPSNDKQFN